MTDQEKLDRAITLLKATQALLMKQYKNPYVLNLIEETVFYDGADCSGDCLYNDIDDLLDECKY